MKNSILVERCGVSRWLLQFLLTGFWLALVGGSRLQAQVLGAGEFASVTNGCFVVNCPTDRTVFICGDTVTVPAELVTGFNRCTGIKLPVVCNPPAGTLLPPGVHKISCGALVDNKPVVSCSFTVTVIKDSVPPTLVCPADILVNGCNDRCVVVNYLAPIATDDSGVVNVVCDPPSGSCFPVGTTFVKCVAFDRCQNRAECAFKVVVQGAGSAPVISCPRDIAVFTCGDCEKVEFPAPVVIGGKLASCSIASGTCFPVGSTAVFCLATNDCGLASECKFLVTVRRKVSELAIRCPEPIKVQAACGKDCAQVDFPAPAVVNGTLVGCVPPSGSCFPVGTTTVVCTAKDDCDREVKCTFAVEVLPNPVIPLVITCPKDIVVVTCGNCAKVEYPAPQVTGGKVLPYSIPSGTCFPIGTIPVFCLATNECGQTAECRFTVTVRAETQHEPPTITCPKDIFVETCDLCQKVNFPAPVVGGGSLAGCFPPSGTCFPVGVHTVFCVATNACGDKSTCRFTVTVQAKASGLAIRCPELITVTAPCGKECVKVDYPAPVVVNGTLVGCNPPSGSCFPVGLNEVICVAKDDCGRQTQCRFLIRVVGQTANPPVLRCPGDLVVVAPCGQECAVVNYPAPLVANGVLASCSPPPGKCLPLGNTIVTCLATNACGQRAECKFTITVRPNPGVVSIQCPANLTFTVPCQKDCVVVNYPRPTVSGGVLVSCTPPPGTCLPVGVHTVLCVAKDACGHEQKCEFTLRVIREAAVPPLIRCPQNLAVVAECGKECAVVNYPAPIVVNGKLVKCEPPSGFCFPIGNTPVTCLATNDCGGKVECRFIVTVRPARQVAIQCPTEPIVVALPCDETCAVVRYPVPMVVNGTLVSCNPPSGTCLPLGTHTVTCVAKDECGRQATCQFSVRVVQSQAQPLELRCPDDIVVNTCDTCAEVAYPAPLVLNGVLLGCNPPAGTCFPIGTNSVVCVAANGCGQTTTCTFNVIVRPGSSCVRPPLNLVLWLGLDEAVGPLAHNLIPGAPHGVHVNGPVPLLGQKVDNSLGFDGIDDSVRVPNYSAIQFGQRNFSIDTWLLRRDDGGRRTIVSKVVAGAAGRVGYEYYLENGIMTLALHSAGGGSVVFSSGVAVPSDNRWHFLAVTVQRLAGVAQAARFYLDGNLVAVVNGGILGSVDNFAPLHVGAGSLGFQNSFLRGYLDELEMFNRVLQPGEVSALWRAGSAGKCKVKCTIPWDVSVPAGQDCVTVLVRLSNSTATPLPVVWSATGPMPIPSANGVVVIDPFSSTNVPVVICRQPNQPAGSVLKWTFRASPSGRCPVECVGSIINPAVPLALILPDLPVVIRGTRMPGTVHIGLDGLPPMARLRLVAVGPDMEPDLEMISLNGLEPGMPWLVDGRAAARGGFPAPAAAQEFDVSIRFVGKDPSGIYTVLIYADLNGDGIGEVVGSFDVESPAVASSLLRVEADALGVSLEWEDNGDGLGTLQGAIDPEGPWLDIPEAAPGYRPDAESPFRFFRLRVGALAE